MAKLPARLKVSVLLYRRMDHHEPDEVLVVQREVQRKLRWVLPHEEAEAGEPAREAALRLAARLVGGAPLADVDLGVGASYRVKDGPRAGEWTERFHAVEVAPGRRPRDGMWLAHFEVKARAGEDAPRVREAVTRLRELAKLKP